MFHRGPREFWSVEEVSYGAERQDREHTAAWVPGWLNWGGGMAARNTEAQVPELNPL